jgi:glycosyltransferase involved in cell wall biosynthesis
MPTKGRREMAQAALDCWLKQDYQNKELVILDDADDLSFPEGLQIPGVHHYASGKKMTLGMKRNEVNALTRGEIIAHFDSDDWSAPDRIQDQISRVQETGLPITGYSTLLFWDVLKQQAKQWKCNIPGYVCGTSLMYKKEFWAIHQFQDKQIASDNSFVYPVLRQVAACKDATRIVARIHGEHTSPKGNITQAVSRDLIPAAFWVNEKLRLGSLG